MIEAVQVVTSVEVEGIEGDASPRAAGAAAPDSLPCLFSNNSTETKSELSTYQRKNAFILTENLEAAIEKYGIEKLGFLTLTFPKYLSLKQANVRFNSLASHVLNDLFVCWICVREFTASMRPHFHLVVVCHEDIREGFNFENYLKMVSLSRKPQAKHKLRKDIKELSRSLNPSPALRHIWNTLRAALPNYGFGRHELIPIRKPQAIARYVGGYIRKSMAMRPESAKGARLVTYSKSFDRRVNGHAWQFNSDGSLMWRMKLEIFAKMHGIEHYEGLKEVLGPRWAWWFRDVIESLNLLAFEGVIGPQNLRAFVTAIDLERLKIANDQGHCPGGMHLYQPELPKNASGEPVTPPIYLRKYFSRHMTCWDQPPKQNFFKFRIPASENG